MNPIRPTVRVGQVWSIRSPFQLLDRQSSVVLSIEGPIAHCRRIGGKSEGQSHDLRIVTLLHGKRGARIEQEAPGYTIQVPDVPPAPHKPKRVTAERSAGDLVKTRPPRSLAATPRAKQALELKKAGLSNPEIAARMGVKLTAINDYLRRAREAAEDERQMAALKRSAS